MTMENKVVPANTNPVDVSQGTSVEIETSAIEQQIHDQAQAQGVYIPEEQMQSLFQMVHASINGAVADENPSATATKTEEHSDSEESTESDVESIPYDDLLNKLLQVDVYDNVQIIGVPGVKELMNFSKRNLAKVVCTLIECTNRRAKEIMELQKELQNERLQNAVLKEQSGRTREVNFGSKSERRSALESGEHKTEKTEEKPDTSAASGVDNASKSTEASGSTHPESSKNSEGDQSAQTKEEPSSKTDASEQEGNSADNSKKPFRKHTSKPKRQVGCADNTAKEAIHLECHKTLDMEELQRLHPGHIFHKLPSGSYETTLIITIPIAMTVTYERAQDKTENKIYSADSAHESKLLSGSDLSTTVLAQLLFQRYSMGVAVTRILRDLEAKGLKYTKQRMYLWSIQYALTLARPMILRLLEKLLEQGKLQTDETWMRIREDLAREGRKNSVLWLIRTSEKLNIPPIVIVYYTGSRSAAEFVKLIRGFSGKIMSDGYSAYGALLNEFADQIELVGCIQHARSNFVDVIQALKGQKKYQAMTEKQRAAMPVNLILDAFGKLFEAERKTDEFATRQEKEQYRLNTVKPLLDELFELIEKYQQKLSQSDSSYWAKALNYAVKFKDRFYNAVKDPDMPLQNSAAERTFANLGIIRSNCKQMDTVMGTVACTLWFSLLRTAKENGANEQVYLEYLCEKLPGLLKTHNDYKWYSQEKIRSLRHDELPGYGSLEYLDELMPWSDDYAEYAKKRLDRKREQIVEIAELITKQMKDEQHQSEEKPDAQDSTGSGTPAQSGA